MRIWDAVTGEAIGSPLGRHKDSVNAVAIGRAGDREIIVSGSDDATVRIWDAVTGEAVGVSLAGYDGDVYAVAIGRAGDREIIVSGSGDRTVLIRQYHPRR